MADGKTHFAVSAMAAGVGAITLLTVGELTREGVLVLFVAGIVGGMLPDIDSGHAPVLNAALTLAAVLASFLAVFRHADHLSVAESLVLWLVVYLGLRQGVFRLLLRMTVHRGIVHSIPAALIAGLAGAMMGQQVFGLSASLAWLAGIFLLLGFLGHLLLDELASLNLFGAGQRKAMGSAFKLYARDWRVSLLAWLLVAGLLWLSPPPADLLHPLLQPAFWQKIQHSLWPRDRRWFWHGSVPWIRSPLACGNEVDPTVKTIFSWR